jgi:hypothetical protein
MLQLLLIYFLVRKISITAFTSQITKDSLCVPTILSGYESWSVHFAK